MVMTIVHFGSLKQRATATGVVWLLVLLGIFFSASVDVQRAAAQTSKGILAGVVRDSTGAVLPNATLVITNEETSESRTVTSPSPDAYRVEPIIPERYRWG